MQKRKWSSLREFFLDKNEKIEACESCVHNDYMRRKYKRNAECYGKCDGWNPYGVGFAYSSCSYFLESERELNELIYRSVKKMIECLSEESEKNSL